MDNRSPNHPSPTPPETSGISEQIKKYRLKRGFTINEIANETKVSITIIKGIEERNYKLLPALAYSCGLITNILEFLEVGNDEIDRTISKFEHDYQLFFSNQKSISEKKKTDLTKISTPAKTNGPLETNSSQQRNYPKSSTFLALMAIVLVGFLLFLFLKYQEKSKISDTELSNNFSIPFLKKSNQKKERVNQAYSLYEGSRTYTVGTGDEIRVFFQNKIVMFQIEEISSKDPVKVKLVYREDQHIALSLFQEMLINLDDDEEKDLLVKFQQTSGDLAILYFSLIDENIKNIDYAEIWNQQKKILIDEKEHLLIKNENKSAIIFYIKATTLPIHLSYNIDGQRQSIINLKPGNQISILAQDHLEIQIGNYRSSQLVINRIPIQLSTKAQDQFSVTKIIKWVPSPNNETRFNLMIKNFIS